MRFEVEITEESIEFEKSDGERFYKCAFGCRYFITETDGFLLRFVES